MTRLGRRVERLADRLDPEPGAPYLALARGLLAATHGIAPGEAEIASFARALAATRQGPTWLAVVALAGREAPGMSALGRRLGRLARAGGGERGPTVVAFLDDWPPEARASYEQAVAEGNLPTQEDMIEAHHGLRPRLVRPDGRPLPEGERSLVVHFVVRPDGP